MPIIVKENSYITSTEIQNELQISRQTLWRWRQDGRVPQGHRNRRQQVIFTPEEAQAIRDFADQVEPIDAAPRDQLNLFDDAPNRTRRT